MELRAVFFDFDGLIVDTESSEVESWRTIFDRYRQPFPFDYFLRAVGRSALELDEFPEDILARSLPNVSWSEIQSAFRAVRERDLAAREARLGVRELIADLTGNDIRRCVVSSSDRAWVESHLARLQLREEFESLFTREDVTRAKPAPDLYLLALERMGLTASEVVVLEDSANGVQAAVDAGLTVIAVPNPLTMHLDLSHANRIVSGHEFLSVKEISTVLEESNKTSSTAPSPFIR